MVSYGREGGVEGVTWEERPFGEDDVESAFEHGIGAVE